MILVTKEQVYLRTPAANHFFATGLTRLLSGLELSLGDDTVQAIAATLDLRALLTELACALVSVRTTAPWIDSRPPSVRPGLHGAELAQFFAR